jgi:bifunctional UDP-N-acetylglucosamine pyrophosphorylase/glucosamine-1-phosphate N-acetyltransferase
MTISAIILTVETSLGDYALAGQSAMALLESTVRQLVGPMAQTSELDQSMAPDLRDWLNEGVDKVLLVRSDRPLLTAATLARLTEGRPAPMATLVTSGGDTPAGCADARWLWEQLQSAPSATTLEELGRAAGARVVPSGDLADCLAVNTLVAQGEAERIIQQRINTAWMQAGVRLVDPAATYIHASVAIGRETVILPNTHLWGATTIGEASRIGPNSIVCDSDIGNRCRITSSVVEQAVMEDESDIGPFGHLRRGSRLCRGAHMGNFGEVKNSTLGPNAKMGHFAYLGDATVGANVNIGAGTITCNYDGTEKHKTIIQDGAFIGSDTMLVAPVEIGAGARTGAGSVITHDVPPGSVAYGVPARIKRTIRKEGESSEPDS